MLRWLVGLMMLSLLSACSPAGILNALAPRAVETRGVRYAAGDRHELDIYAPTGQPRHPAPVVVFIYGGGWKDGDRAEYRFVAAALAARGFLTVVPDYRLFPAVRFPAFLQDNAAAVAWTKANIARYGGDPGRLFLMGHSAGAYNVAMLTLDKQWLAAEGLDADRDIAGTIGLAGPYDFLPLHDPELEDIFGPAGDLRRSQPITFARGDAPPMLLAAGTADTTVLPRNTEHLAAALHLDGGQAEERLYRGVDHTRIIGAMSGLLRWLAPSMTDVTGFLDKHAGRLAAFGFASDDGKSFQSVAVLPREVVRHPMRVDAGFSVTGLFSRLFRAVEPTHSVDCRLPADAPVEDVPVTPAVASVWPPEPHATHLAVEPPPAQLTGDDPFQHATPLILAPTITASFP